MKRLGFVLTVATALAATGILVASSAGGPPPPTFAHFGVTHARPVAGRVFTGLTITPATYAIERVSCDATVKGATLRARQRRFYDSGVVGPAAITCSWKIPANARGTLSVDVTDWTADGRVTQPVSWRIKR